MSSLSGLIKASINITASAPINPIAIMPYISKSLSTEASSSGLTMLFLTPKINVLNLKPGKNSPMMASGFSS